MTTYWEEFRIAEKAGRDARELYENGGMCCSEAVLWVLNREFEGGLSRELATALSKGFCGGIGDAGCVCGALSGAIMGLSLILCKDLREDGDDRVRALSKELHDRFEVEHGAVCCRILSRDRDHESDSKGICLDYVESAANICARILLNPDIAGLTVSTASSAGALRFQIEKSPASRV